MEWRERDRYTWDSDLGYRISIAHVRDVVYYSAWTPEPRTLLGISPAQLAAQQYCEDHARDRATPAVHPAARNGTLAFLLED
jgi:hypothetical protein